MSLIEQILSVFGLAMIPVFELRGAIPVGVAAGLPFWTVFLTAFLGNLLPVPFLILFTRRVFEWLRTKSALLERFVSRLERKAATKEDLLKKYELLGLCILVAIPLPGTGAWTGTLAGSILDMKFKDVVKACMGGVLLAGIIMGLASAGLLGALSTLFSVG